MACGSAARCEMPAASRCGSHHLEERYWTTRPSRHCGSRASRARDRPPALPAAQRRNVPNQVLRGRPGLLPAGLRHARPAWRAHASWPTLRVCTATAWSGVGTGHGERAAMACCERVRPPWRPARRAATVVDTAYDGRHGHGTRRACRHRGGRRGERARTVWRAGGQRCVRARPAWRATGRRGRRAWRASGRRGHGMRRAFAAVAKVGMASGAASAATKGLLRSGAVPQRGTSGPSGEARMAAIEVQENCGVASCDAVLCSAPTTFSRCWTSFAGAEVRPRRQGGADGKENHHWYEQRKGMASGAYTSVTRMREVVEGNIVHTKILEFPYLAPWVSVVNKGIYAILPVT